MEFRWYCKQLSESYQMDPDEPTKRLYENGDFVPEVKRTVEEIDNIKTELGSSFQKGGCFGKGPGTIIENFYFY